MGKPGALYREKQRKELRQKDTMQELKTAFKGSTAGSWITFGDDFLGKYNLERLVSITTQKQTDKCLTVYRTCEWGEKQFQVLRFCFRLLQVITVITDNWKCPSWASVSSGGVDW